MGKHDEVSHYLHIPKAMKFKQHAPAAFQRAMPPAQKPRPGTDAQNMYK